jgi:hypothetical protein
MNKTTPEPIGITAILADFQRRFGVNNLSGSKSQRAGKIDSEKVELESRTSSVVALPAQKHFDASITMYIERQGQEIEVEVEIAKFYRGKNPGAHPNDPAFDDDKVVLGKAVVIGLAKNAERHSHEEGTDSSGQNSEQASPARAVKRVVSVRATCILDLDSPSFPPSDYERKQCGCKHCLADLPPDFYHPGQEIKLTPAEQLKAEMLVWDLVYENKT